jgi:hypothetical protein
VPFGRVTREAGIGRLGGRVRRLRAGQGETEEGGTQLRGLHQLVWPPPDLKAFSTSRRFWEPSAVDAFTMTFPARVRVIAMDGSEQVATCTTPRGGAGHTVEGPEAVSRVKMATWGPWLWADEGTESLAKAIDTDEDALWQLL